MNSSTKYNPLYDPKTDNMPIDPAVQASMNRPMASDSYSQADQEFLNLIMRLIEEGKINLYVPSSLLNTEIYEKMNEAEKGKADQNAVLMLNKIREIHNLMKFIKEPNFQVKNLVDSLRQNKEAMEKIDGDVYII